jgi:hypothetical protein
MNADINFKNAVAKQGQGCNFGQIVAIAAAIATLVASGGTAAPLIATAWGALSQSVLKDQAGNAVQDNFSGFKYRVSAVATAGKDVSSFVNAFDQVKGLIDPKQKPGSQVADLPSDEAKILASASDIEQQLKPFMNLPEAQKYKGDIDAFVAAAQARNNKIMEYNNLITSWNKIQADIVQDQADADAAQNSISATQNPFIADAANFMAKAYRATIADIIQMLTQLNRSYQFYALSGTDITIDSFSVDALRSTKDALMNAYDKTRGVFGAAPSNIVGQEIDLMPYVPTAIWKTFRSTGKITVTIGAVEKELAAWSFVLMTKVQIKVIGPNGEPQDLQATIYHEGRALIFDESGTAFTFSHVPVPVPFERQNGAVVIDGSVASDVGDYVGLTPYGPWTIQIDPATIDAGFLQTAQRMSFIFTGKARGRKL